jgi:hypothetical protein
MLPDAVPIGRHIPDLHFDAIIHTAAPNFRDDNAVIEFREFNRALEDHLAIKRPDVLVVTGSWWQHAEGTCRHLLYTHLKNEQVRIFKHAVHVLPYSIYGDEPRPGRGFIPQLVLAVRGEIALAGLSRQQRDFIHVTDVALAHIRALDAPRGIYTAATRHTFSPRGLASRWGVRGADFREHPLAMPRYLAPQVPGWESTVDVLEHIAGRV